MNSKRKIIVIAGPTASGKTSWGVLIAKKFNGEIISADSRQVYKGLDIGTGKDLEDYGDISYHLIDICKPGEVFTLFDWLKLAREAIEDIFSRSKTPVIVGGTGLYIQSLIEGFELAKSKKLRAKSNYTRQELEKKSLGELQEIISKLEISNSKLDINNSHRIIRAIERAQNGEIVTQKKPSFEALQIAIDLPREVLYWRIDQRVDSRFEEGMLEEVTGLIKSGVDKNWLLSLGLEYRTITDFIISHLESISGSENGIEFERMKQELKYKIHAYARRQLTWFRRFPEIIWCKDLRSAEKEIVNFLN